MQVAQSQAEIVECLGEMGPKADRFPQVLFRPFGLSAGKQYASEVVARLRMGGGETDCVFKEGERLGQTSQPMQDGPKTALGVNVPGIEPEGMI